MEFWLLRAFKSLTPAPYSSSLPLSVKKKLARESHRRAELNLLEDRMVTAIPGMDSELAKSEKATLIHTRYYIKQLQEQEHRLRRHIKIAKERERRANEILNERQQAGSMMMDLDVSTMAAAASFPSLLAAKLSLTDHKLFTTDSNFGSPTLHGGRDLRPQLEVNLDFYVNSLDKVRG